MYSCYQGFRTSSSTALHSCLLHMQLSAAMSTSKIVWLFGFHGYRQLCVDSAWQPISLQTFVYTIWAVRLAVLVHASTYIALNKHTMSANRGKPSGFHGYRQLFLYIASFCYKCRGHGKQWVFNQSTSARLSGTLGCEGCFLASPPLSLGLALEVDWLIPGCPYHAYSPT